MPLLVILCGIVVAGFACNWAAWRLNVPSILLLLVTGIVAGPLLGWLAPDTIFGSLLIPFVSIAVAIILFEGSLTLRFEELRGHGNVVRNLVTVGVLVTWCVATVSAHYLMDWDIWLAALFGAIVTVSGPTVIIPLLRSVRPKNPLSSILRWEGILIDPIGAIFALLVYDLFIVSQTATGVSAIAIVMTRIVLVGGGLGVAIGYLFGLSLRRHYIPDYLRDYAALAAVLLVYGGAESLAHESGLIAVTIMGVWLANMRDVRIDDVLDFKESLTLVLVAVLFIVLAARLQLDKLLALGGGGLLVLVILQVLGGPLRAFIATMGSTLKFREKLFLGWIFPRGIVAAAVSALFAIRLQQRGYTGAEELVPLVFTVILGTVIIQGLTAKPLSRWLGVAEPDPTGVLVVGGNRVALTFAKALQDCGRNVLLVNDSWPAIREARMMGLKVYYGSPVSSYADRNLDLAGIGYLLAASRRPSLNELACVHFASDFGRNAVYVLGNESEAVHDKHRISGASVGRTLFRGEHSVDTLDAILLAGAELKTTGITKEFSFADYREKYPDAAILFVSNDNGGLKFPVDITEMAVDAGWSVSALIATAANASSTPDKHN